MVAKAGGWAAGDRSQPSEFRRPADRMQTLMSNTLRSPMMSAAAAGLKRLHDLHLRLQELQHKLEHGPRQVKARQQILARKQAEVDAMKAELKQARLMADQKNLQLKTNEVKIADLKAKLNQAASNREFDIIRSQIDADTMANSVLEDEILEVLDKVDQIQQKIGKGDAEAAQFAAEVHRVAGEVESTAPQLRSQASEIEVSLREEERILPSSTIEGYRRLVQAHGAAALASVEGNACTACNEILSPNSLVELNTGKFIFCRSCGRLLYRPEHEPAGRIWKANARVPRPIPAPSGRSDFAALFQTAQLTRFTFL